MKVAIFSGRLNSQRIKSIKEAANLARSEDADLLILPGHSFNELGTDSNSDYSPQHLSGEYSIPVLAETHRTVQNNQILGKPNGKEFQKGNSNGLSFPWQTHLFFPDGRTSGPMHQKFATSAQATMSAVESLNNEINSGIRDFCLVGIPFRVLLCGELNFLTNSGPEQRVSSRYNTAISLDYRVLLNPTHTNMGNLGKMYRRFEFLSQDNKIYIMTTNCMTKCFGKSCFYIAMDGKVTHKGEDLKGNSENWRMAFLDIPIH